MDNPRSRETMRAQKIDVSDALHSFLINAVDEGQVFALSRNTDEAPCLPGVFIKLDILQLVELIRENDPNSTKPFFDFD